MKICQIGICFNIYLLFIIVLRSCNLGLDYCGNSGEKAIGNLDDFINDFAFGGEKFLVYNVERCQDIIAPLEDFFSPQLPCSETSSPVRFPPDDFLSRLSWPVQKLCHKVRFSAQ